MNCYYTLHPRYFLSSDISLITYLTVSLSGSLFSTTTLARDYFNPAQLEIDSPQQENIDLSVFEDEASQAPGVYRVDIFINNDARDTHDVTFQMKSDADGKERLLPCLSVAQLNSMGVKTDLFPGLGDNNTPCASLNAIPHARAEFRFSTQQLMLSIPQAALSNLPRGYVRENQWDAGIPAFLLNYSLNGARSNAGTGSQSHYANLRPGINTGPWRIRNYVTWSREKKGQDKWAAVYSYAQRDIVSLKSQLVLGDRSSQSDIFDSMSFRGAQLASDDDMIPDSIRGYAPVVRGIARTSAQVIIRQNGYVIYQSYVAPGAFEINDMYPTGGSGDLNVTIKEADGSEQYFVVPFASLPVLQREGRLKYALTVGQYRSYDSTVNKTPFGQGSAIYGLPLGLTMYSGLQFSRPYQSFALGMGKNMGGWGAISADVTHASASMMNQPEAKGQSWRLRYSKNMVTTGTSVAIAGYRYSTAGYYSMQEVLETWRNQRIQTLNERRRNRSELTLTQTLWWEGAGSLALSLVNEDFWNSDRSIRSASAGYNNNYQGISYGLTYSHNQNISASRTRRYGQTSDTDHLFSFNISIPLERGLSHTYASYSLNTSQNRGATHTAGLNGTSLEDRNMNWSVQQGYDAKGTGYGGNLTARYRGTYGEVNAGYAYDGNSQRLNYGVQGSMVAHEKGITLGQLTGETLALVEAPGASGVGINGHNGVRTDWRGYAVVPYTSPYRKNQIQLQTATLPDNVDFELTSQHVIPTRGAIVRARFVASIGQRVLMSLQRPKGESVPFGAIVTDEKQKTQQGFIVGEAGEVYLTGLDEKGTLNVAWGNSADKQCRAAYSLDKYTEGVQKINVQCL